MVKDWNLTESQIYGLPYFGVEFHYLPEEQKSMISEKSTVFIRIS